MGSRQWGHGFHAGRNQIISDLLTALRGDVGYGQAAVSLRQAGGKYCTFECPKCKAKGQNYKMTANAGWCDKCGASYHNFKQYHRITPEKGMNFYDFIGTVEVEP